MAASPDVDMATSSNDEAAASSDDEMKDVSDEEISDDSDEEMEDDSEEENVEMSETTSDLLDKADSFKENTVDSEGRLLVPSSSDFTSALTEIKTLLNEKIEDSQSLDDSHSTAVAESVLKIAYHPQGLAVGLNSFLQLIDKHFHPSVLNDSKSRDLLDDCSHRLILMMSKRWTAICTESTSNKYNACLVLQEWFETHGLTTRYEGRFRFIERLDTYIHTCRVGWWLAKRVVANSPPTLPAELLTQVQNDFYNDTRIKKLLDNIEEHMVAADYGVCKSTSWLEGTFAELEL